MTMQPEDIIIARLVPWLKRELHQLVSDRSFETLKESEKVINTTFEELRERTSGAQYDVYSDGLDLSSRAGSDRIALYNCRVELARNTCWFAPLHAEGLKWTSDPILGIRWFHEMHMDRAENRATTAVLLWEIAKETVPHRLRGPMRQLLREARDFRHGVGSTRAKTSTLIADIQEGSATEPLIVKKCSVCGLNVNPGDPFEPDGRGGIRHRQQHGCSPPP